MGHRSLNSFVWALALFGTGACGGAGGSKAASEAEPAEREPSSAEAGNQDEADAGDATSAPKGDPGVKEDGEVVSAVTWFEGSLEAALAEAKSSNRLVFVEVGAYWCPPCHELDEKTFTDPTFAKALAELAVPLHIDAEKGEGPEIVERYGVQAYPTVLLLEASGVEKGRLVDFIEPGPMLERLRTIAEGGNVLAELVAAAEANPEDLEAAYALANAYALAAKVEPAETLYEKILAGDPDNAAGLASKVLYDRALFVVHKAKHDAEGAIEVYRELQRRYPDSPEALNAYRKIGRALNDLGRPDEAIASLDQMVEKNPAKAASYGWFTFREKCHPEKGLAVVTKALESSEALADGDRAELAYLSGELHHRLGDDAAALAAMKRASEAEPKSAFYKRMVSRFEEAN